MSRIQLLFDLIEDVRAVADDLQTIADVMASDDPADVPSAESAEMPVSADKAETTAENAESTEKPEPNPPPTIRLEDVRSVLAAKSRDGYSSQVRELIAKHGGMKLSDIDPSEYGAMMEEAEVFGHAT